MGGHLSVKDCINEANRLNGIGNYLEAKEFCEKAVRGNPAHGPIYKTRGDSLYGLEKYEDAIKDYQIAVESSLEPISGYIGMAKSLYKLERYEEALEVYKKISELDKESEIAIQGMRSCYQGFINRHIITAESLYNSGEYEEAIKSYERALELDKESEIAIQGIHSCHRGFMNRYINAAESLYNSERYEEALKLYEKALEFDKDHEVSIKGKYSCHLKLCIPINIIPENYIAPIGEEYKRILKTMKIDIPELFRIDTIVDGSEDHMNNNPEIGTPLLTYEEYLTVTIYTYDLGSIVRKHNFYYIYNSILRDPNPNPGKLRALIPYMYYFEKAWRSLPTEGRECYRGVEREYVKLDKYSIGTIVHWNAITSVSTNRETAEGFAGPDGIVFVINILCGKNVKIYSYVETENELMIKPGSRFTVIGSHENVGGRTIVHLQQNNSEIFIF